MLMLFPRTDFWLYFSSSLKPQFDYSHQKYQSEYVNVRGESNQVKIKQWTFFILFEIIFNGKHKQRLGLLY